jgi:hypothetical protein
MKTHWPRPDFLAPSRRTPRLAWLWAAVGALVLAVTVGEGWAMQRDIDAQRIRLAQAQKRITATAPTPARPALRASADTKAEAEALRAAQRVMGHVNHPWGLLLAAIESETPAGVQWLVFDHDADSAELRFEGLAADAATALRLADALSARAGWSEVALSRLQAPDAAGAAASASAWRFEMRAVVDALRVAAPTPAGGS